MRNEPQLTKAVEVFYSYSHNDEDEELKDGLLKQLAGVERQGVIASWHDRGIAAGQEWAGQIDEHINSAGVILLLVSPDFMASGYCNDVELRRALERHEAGEARVIPVILRPTLWKGAPFGKLQMLPTDARPVTLWGNRDEALLNVAEGILKAVEEAGARTADAPAGRESQPAANVPRAPAVGFVARRDEQGRDIVELLGKELAPDKNHLVALWGPGGAGKSTLAAEFVRASADLFEGRVAWVSALGRVDFGLATLLDEVATRLGREDLRKLAPEPKAARVAALVYDAPALIVLDNFETVSQDEQGRCLDFLAQSAACPALITTRSRVNRDDVYNVPLAAMTTEEASDFLGRLVGRTRKPSNFERLDRDQLIRRCEANPLVLEWVVRQVDLSNRPQDVLDDLAQGEGDAAERVFTRSFNLPQLGEDGRTALLALSLFTPDASREALAEVCGLGDERRRLKKAVEALSALWLVETTEGNERLFLRGLTRELAKSRLSKAPRADEFRRRYVQHFLRHAESHKQQTPEDLNALESEKDNLLGAIDEASALKHFEEVIRLRVTLDYFFVLRGYWDESISSGMQAEAAARESGTNLEAAFIAASRARILNERGDYDDARKIYRDVLGTFRRLGLEKNVSICLHQLGIIAQRLGDLEEARRLYNESLEIRRKLSHLPGVANSLHQLGRLAKIQGEIENARRLYVESLEMKRRIGDEQSTAITLHELGSLAYNQNNLDEARKLYGESMKINQRFGNQYGIAGTTRYLGLLAESEGDRTEAARLFREALRILEKLGSPDALVAREDLRRLEGESS